jgi:hypothetical protein
LGIAQAFFGDILSIVLFALLAAGIMKIFQVASDVREMKDAVLDIKRNTQDIPLPVPARQAAPQSGPISPEELVRSVNASSYKDDEFPALEPTGPPQS